MNVTECATCGNNHGPDCWDCERPLFEHAAGCWCDCTADPEEQAEMGLPISDRCGSSR